MAITFPHDCPYCGTRKVGFTAVYNWSVRGASNEKNILGLCNGCRQGVIFMMSLRHQSADFDFVGQGAGDLERNALKIEWSVPVSIISNVPESLPEPVESLYRQAISCIQQESWDAAGMTLRKVLEVSIKDLNRDTAGMSLQKRIDKLEEIGVITSEIKAWSHEIRLDGNEAAHDEILFDKNKAEGLRSFVESYLRYVHTLPEMVRQSRMRRSGEI